MMFEGYWFLKGSFEGVTITGKIESDVAIYLYSDQD